MSAIFGCSKLHDGILRRICRYVNAELWCQVRRMQDLLRMLCYVTEPPWRADIKVRCERRLAAQLTEFWWSRRLNEILMNSRKESKGRHPKGFVALRDVIFEEVACVLNKGPKYSYEPIVLAHDLLALNRSVASKAEQESQERCLLGGVDALKKTVLLKANKRAKDPAKDVVLFF